MPYPSYRPRELCVRNDTGTMQDDAVITPGGVEGVLFDLLMGIMNSMATWSAAAHDRQRGLAWRDRVTARMVASGSYVPYAEMVAEAANEIGLPANATAELIRRWSEMQPWPDATALVDLSLPYAFVTNCSAELAGSAARRSGLDPRFTLSAQEAGWFKPDARVYRQACLRLGTTPERTMFVAGSRYDADGAHAAGLRALYVARRRNGQPADRSISTISSLESVLAALH